MKRIHRLFGWVAILSLATLAPVAYSQTVAPTSFPAKTITMVVPFSPGGGTDQVARLVAKHLFETFKTPVVVENKAGASTQIGTRAVVEAAADGHTLLVGTTSLINGPFLFAKLPYDASKQLRPVASLADLPIYLAVNSGLGANNLPGFLDLARKNKGAFNYGSAGPGTTLHMSAEWLKTNAGFDATHVPFKGSGDAVTALAGNQVQFNMENLGPVLPMVQAKRVNLLAIAAPQRHPKTPDVPTFKEFGLPDINLSTWIFLMAPAGTPDAVVARLNAAVNEILQRADVKEQLFANGFVPTGGTTADMLKRMDREAAQWGQVIRTAKITAQ
jgi:tripartite-type tricarboxylate transporter receptor subunit TctC